MLVSESFLNATEGYRWGDSDPYEPYTDNIARLFRDMQKEYGRCVSSVYVDAPEGGVKRVGWVFQKKMQYEDSREWYTREVWVTLYDAPDTVTRERHYHALGSE